MPEINGRWTYRSLLNAPDIALPFDALRFGAGNMDLTCDAAGGLTGTLGSSGWSLDLRGTVATEGTSTLRFQGTGVIGGENWVYDYLGYVVPDWPHGVDQTDAIVGSVIRTEPHGEAPAGFVASFYAVRQM